MMQVELFRRKGVEIGSIPGAAKMSKTYKSDKTFRIRQVAKNGIHLNHKCALVFFNHLSCNM